MKILLLNQFFWPDMSATSQLITDVARHLAGAKHQVTAVCGSGTYVSGEEENSPDVEIIRLPTPKFMRGHRRLISYLSYLAGAVWYGFRVPRGSTVVTLTTPPLLSVVGALIQKFRGATHYIWEMDVYPDLAVNLGVLQRRSVLTRILGALADYARQRADGIIVLGDCMRRRLVAHGIPEHKIHVAENWADAQEISPRPFPKTRSLTFLYSGNLGIAHDVDTLKNTMRTLASDPRFEFIFAGGGAHYQEMIEYCCQYGISNARFRPYCAQSALSESLSDGHVGVVTQKMEALGALVPSKAYGIMAAGRPILFIGPKEATTARMIEQFRCGWQVDCGDTSSLIDLLKYLSDHRQVIHVAGALASRAFLDHYDRPIGLARLAEALGVSTKVEPDQVRAFTARG